MRGGDKGTSFEPWERMNSSRRWEFWITARTLVYREKSGNAQDRENT